MTNRKSFNIQFLQKYARKCRNNDAIVGGVDKHAIFCY